MNSKHAIAAFSVVLLALYMVPAVDAYSEIRDNPTGTLKFDNMNGGDISFTVWSEGSNSIYTMEVTVFNGGTVLTTDEFDIWPGNNDISIHINSLDTGSYILTLTLSNIPSDFKEPTLFTVRVQVETNILSNWATYAVIIVAVIIIVIFAYLKIRDTPKQKPEMTFEELEAQRKAKMAQKAEKRQKESSTLSTTERKRYLGRGKDEAQAIMEKKAKKSKQSSMIFEEFDAQRQDEKVVKAKKKSTDLTERERYLKEKRKKKQE